MFFNAFECKFALPACLQPPKTFLHTPPHFKFLEITLETRVIDHEHGTRVTDPKQEPRIAAHEP